MRVWHKRLITVSLIMICVSLGAGIILKTFNDNILFFFSPTDLVERSIKPSEKMLRVGGIVKVASIRKIKEGTIEFIITDNQNDLTVKYSGILPNLFKEKQGTVALGSLSSPNYFEAKELLAKHDENYIPKEVADSLKEKGLWRENLD